MTAYATRAPLQLIENPHMMSEVRGNGRRTSARLADKEDASASNGIGHSYETLKRSQSGAGTTRQGKASTNSSKAGGKRKPAYDEEDDGFAFTRSRSKKPKAEPQQTIAEEQTEEEAAKPTPPKGTRKRSQGSPGAVTDDGGAKVEKRRSKRHSGRSQDGPDPPPLAVKKKRKARASAEPKPPEEGNQPQPGDGAQDRTRPIEITFDATKIALPFADTPIIRRNQEMRRGAANGSRRSSLGMRGRRASSLIDAGRSNALPHDEVESSEFYKHIESEGLSEPRRMRQLLTWCGTRALGQKPSVSSEDSNAILAAREIQSQLLQDFSTKSELSDWFNRIESTPPPLVPKPNPKNVSNLAKISELEQQIFRLQSERQTWESLLRAPPPTHPTLPPLPSNPPDPTSISPTILSDPTQQLALSTLLQIQTSTTNDDNEHQPFLTKQHQPFLTKQHQPSLTKQTSHRLHRVTHTLEFEIDKFAGNVHALESYCTVAERLAEETLGLTARILEGRDGEGERRALVSASDYPSSSSSSSSHSVGKSNSRLKNGNGEGGERGGGGGGAAGAEIPRSVGTRELLRGLSRVIDR